MKKKVLFTLLAGLFIIQFAYNQDKKELCTCKIKVAVDCKDSKSKFEYAMAYEKGIKSCEADMNTGIATITFKTAKTSKEKIELAIKKLGFDVESKSCNDHHDKKHPSYCGEKH